MQTRGQTEHLSCNYLIFYLIYGYIWSMVIIIGHDSWYKGNLGVNSTLQTSLISRLFVGISKSSTYVVVERRTPSLQWNIKLRVTFTPYQIITGPTNVRILSDIANNSIFIQILRVTLIVAFSLCLLLYRQTQTVFK